MIVPQKHNSGKIKMHEGRLTREEVELSERDIDRIIELEIKTNIPQIRATKEKILYRFSKRSRMLGIETSDGKLLASVAWRFAKFFPDKPDELPKDFGEYSTPNDLPPEDFNSIFHYGINIDPAVRKAGLGGVVGREIFAGMVNRATAAGCVYAVSDPRLHTYNGSFAYPEIERFSQDLKMKEVVDKALKGERKFTLDDALRDPAFRIYYRLTGRDTKLIKLMPSTWFPQDTPSGGHGILVYKELRR